MQEDLHETDRRFLRLLRQVNMGELKTLLRFQACELWRRIAIEREIERRHRGIG